jgi:CRISPR system Cascade subunit CasD
MMRDYLVIRLYGPLASWGEIAVGESRHSADHPSRSALLGLLGAALGVNRSDEAGQQALAQGYRFAIKLIRPGFPLRDYHTVQAPSQQRKVTYYTRRQELMDKSKVGTLLSSREYRCDSIVLVAIQAEIDAPASLEKLVEHLKYPVFPLYLGRKSCPLAVPLHPQLLTCATAKEAINGAIQPALADLCMTSEAVWPGKLDQYYLRTDAPRYYWEDGIAAGMAATMTVTRYDAPLSRSKWQFLPRNEQVLIEEKDK